MLRSTNDKNINMLYARDWYKDLILSTFYDGCCWGIGWEGNLEENSLLTITDGLEVNRDRIRFTFMEDDGNFIRRYLEDKNKDTIYLACIICLYYLTYDYVFEYKNEDSIIYKNIDILKNANSNEELTNALIDVFKMNKL